MVLSSFEKRCAKNKSLVMKIWLLFVCWIPLAAETQKPFYGSGNRYTIGVDIGVGGNYFYLGDWKIMGFNVLSGGIVPLFSLSSSYKMQSDDRKYNLTLLNNWFIGMQLDYSPRMVYNYEVKHPENEVARYIISDRTAFLTLSFKIGREFRISENCRPYLAGGFGVNRLHVERTNEWSLGDDPELNGTSQGDVRRSSFLLLIEPGCSFRNNHRLQYHASIVALVHKNAVYDKGPTLFQKSLLIINLHAGVKFKF